jgi:hypothetical protein
MIIKDFKPMELKKNIGNPEINMKDKVHMNFQTENITRPAER